MRELIKLLSTKSTIPHLLRNGTAGLPRSAVSGYNRSVLPPARISARTRGRVTTATVSRPGLAALLLTAGSFYQHGEWTFGDVQDPETTIVVHLTHEHDKALVVEVDDPQRAAQAINAAVATTRCLLGARCKLRPRRASRPPLRRSTRMRHADVPDRQERIRTGDSRRRVERCASPSTLSPGSRHTP